MVLTNNNSTATHGVSLTKPRIVWLSSYPKSGNTWFRAFISNLLYGGSVPVDINKLAVPWGISRRQFDRLCGLDSSLLLPYEIDALWPEVAMRFSNGLADTPTAYLLKTHGAYGVNKANTFLEAKSINRAIYLVRNPLDVCISFAHHSSWSIDQTIQIMGDEFHTRCQRYNYWNPSFREQVSSWSINVSSWLNTKAFPVLILHYEDLLSNPLVFFEKAVKFLEIDADPALILQAVEFSAFNVLQGQEQLSGFHEKGSKTPRFFRHGCAGTWRTVLSKMQIKRLLHDHGQLMDAVGYATNIL